MKAKKQGFSSRKSLRYRGTECLNCGQPLDKSDVYCPYCSQLNSRKHLSVTDFFAEFVGSLLVYDSRLRLTLRHLLFFPGRITKNYIQGKRLKYANPFRFFLSVSIIYFLVKGIFGAVDPAEKKSIGEMAAGTSDTEILKGDATHPPDFFTSELRNDSVTAKKMDIEHYYSDRLLDSLSFFDNLSERGYLYLEYHYKHPTVGSEKALHTLNHKNSFKNRWLYNRMTGLKKIMDDPRSFLEYFISKMPFFLFFFAPFFALFFWLIYSRIRYTYMEHMIFIFHIFSFIFLLKLLISIPELIFDITLLSWPLIFLIGAIYFYFALKNFYGQGHLRTFIKFVFLGFIFNTSFFFALIIFVTGTAAIY